MDDYTNHPTHIRVVLDAAGVFFDELGDPLPEPRPGYTIDGADDDGNYTIGCWSGYETLAEALSDVPAFIEATEIDGVVWHWDPDRPKGLRRAPKWGAAS